MNFRVEERNRKGKPQTGLFIIGMFIAQNKSIAIGTNDVEGLHDRIKAVYPEAKLSKGDGAVIVEKRE